jgi:hypothetical protein
MYIPRSDQLVNEAILFLLAIPIIIDDDIADGLECMEKPSADRSADNPNATPEIVIIILSGGESCRSLSASPRIVAICRPLIPPLKSPFSLGGMKNPSHFKHGLWVSTLAFELIQQL